MTKVAVLVLLGGCSLSLPRPDPRRPWPEPPQCTTNMGVVVLDGLAASTLALGGIVFANDNSSDFPDRHAAGAAMVGLAAVYAVAAYIGARTVDDCRAAIIDYEAHAAVPAIVVMPPAPPPDSCRDAP